MAGEMDHVLAGSAADLDHVARTPGEVLFKRRPERLVIAVKGRRVEPAVGFDPTAVPAKFDDIFSQLKSPENEKADENAIRAKRPEKLTGPNRLYERTSSSVAMRKILTPFCSLHSLDCQDMPVVLLSTIFPYT
jgi:hypothetical protein